MQGLIQLGGLEARGREIRKAALVARLQLETQDRMVQTAFSASVARAGVVAEAAQRRPVLEAVAVFLVAEQVEAERL